LASPSGYKCNDSIEEDKASLAFGDGPKGFSLLANLTTFSGLFCYNFIYGSAGLIRM
jgi:hypothetical protein